MAVLATVGTWFKSVTAWLFHHPVVSLTLALVAWSGTVWLKDQEWFGAKLLHDLLYGTAWYTGAVGLAGLIPSPLPTKESFFRAVGLGARLAKYAVAPWTYFQDLGIQHAVEWYLK